MGKEAWRARIAREARRSLAGARKLAPAGRTGMPAHTLAAAMVALAVLTLAPAAAQAELKKGDPEIYSNQHRLGTGEAVGISQIGYGDIELESKELPGGLIECANLALGTGYNGESPPRALGQILAFTAEGHAPGEGGDLNDELSAQCRGPAGTAWATDETPIKMAPATEATRGALSTPWNVEGDCGKREGAAVTILKIGVPTTRTEAEKTADEAKKCVTEAAEKTEEENEVTKKEGCYRSSPSPAGCIAVTVLDPSMALEVAYGGTQRAKVVNGVANGLDQTRWELEGEKSGALQCTYPVACTAKGTTSGLVKQQGYEAVQLIYYR